VYLAIGSLTGAEVSSDEQDNINKNIVTMESSFFIRRHLEYKYIVFKPIPILSQYDKSKDLSKAGELGESKAYDEISKYCN
jgi:hypothetical protein